MQQINQNYYILGDFNGHHPIWEPLKNPIPNNCGTKLAQILTENDNFCLATPQIYQPTPMVTQEKPPH